jgi:hypothetical protein
MSDQKCPVCKVPIIGHRCAKCGSEFLERSSATVRRTIHPEVKVLDATQGIVEYIASDETIDCYREVVKASGWKFDDFSKNAPFVDSHDYSSIDKVLGKVVDFKIEARKLIETVKWAIDVPTNFLAIKGFAMMQAGYLKAVSVGFVPTRWVTKWDSDPSGWQAALKDLNLHEEDGVNVVYLEQQQKELSACVIGANPSAVARAYKAGILNDADLETLSVKYVKANPDDSADEPAVAESSLQQARMKFLIAIQSHVARL